MAYIILIYLQLTEDLVPKLCDFGLARVKSRLNGSTSTDAKFHSGTKYVSQTIQFVYEKFTTGVNRYNF